MQGSIQNEKGSVVPAKQRWAGYLDRRIELEALEVSDHPTVQTDEDDRVVGLHGHAPPREDRQATGVEGRTGIDAGFRRRRRRD
jgi:hypothetical protein